MSEVKQLVADRLAEADALVDEEFRQLAVERGGEPHTARLSTPSGNACVISIRGGADDAAGQYDNPNVWLRVKGRGRGARWWDQYNGWIGRFQDPSMRDFDDIEIGSAWADRRDALVAMSLLALAIVPWLVGTVYVVADVVAAAT